MRSERCFAQLRASSPHKSGCTASLTDLFRSLLSRRRLPGPNFTASRLAMAVKSSVASSGRPMRCAPIASAPRALSPMPLRERNRELKRENVARPASAEQRKASVASSESRLRCCADWRLRKRDSTFWSTVMPALSARSKKSHAMSDARESKRELLPIQAICPFFSMD